MDSRVAPVNWCGRGVNALTLSIAVRDPNTGEVGAAVTSRFFAAGSIVPWTLSGVGAICTQALCDPRLGASALRALEAGVPIASVLRGIIGGLANRRHAQIHGIAVDGDSAAITGEDCVEWSGSVAGDGASVAGNMLAGPGVVDATLEGFLDSAGRPLAERLLHALTAGERAGGDKRGKQSAAVVVRGSSSVLEVNLRSDDHPEPVAELWRLYQVGHTHYFAFRAATRDDSPERKVLEQRLEAWLARHGDADFSKFWSRDPWKEG
jgi:uncharacterized Ntn-hydrolase superfamily protein